MIQDMKRRPCGVIAAEIVGQVFWKFGRAPTRKEQMLCVLITEALAAERKATPRLRAVGRAR